MPCMSTTGDPAAATNYLTCDFCGADIFQSFFECKTCTKSEYQDIGDGFVVCAGCYAEGRCCQCEVMIPTLCYPFQRLLEHRVAAVNALQAHRVALDIPQRQVIIERNASSSSFLIYSTFFGGTFAAGCILVKTRKAALNDKKVWDSLS
jgi:hypothetical protein